MRGVGERLMEGIMLKLLPEGLHRSGLKMFAKKPYSIEVKPRKSEVEG